MLRLIEHPRTAGHLGSRRICLSVFVPLTAILQGSVKKKAHFFGRFCGVRNASLRRTFCCVVHQKRDFKAHPAASTTLLVGSFQLAADSRLSTHSPSTLDLGSLFSTLETRDPATACVDSEASNSTVALGKAFSMVATTQPHASSFVIHPLHRIWFYDPERAIRTSLRARPELRARATPRGRVNPRVRLTDWLLAATLARGWTVARAMEDLHTHKNVSSKLPPK